MKKLINKEAEQTITLDNLNPNSLIGIRIKDTGLKYGLHFNGRAYTFRSSTNYLLASSGGVLEDLLKIYINNTNAEVFVFDTLAEFANWVLIK